MIRVALVGCGKIADSHAEQIRRIGGALIVGVSDREELMAEQFCERFAVHRRYTNIDALIRDARPDVIHITTPPQSHYALTKTCLERGCHVYVEKPFTVYAWQAEELLELAESNGLKLVVGHDAQFSPAAVRMRALIEAGYLGGPPVHIESYYCYTFGDAYGAALLGDRTHWIRSLPGQLLQNVVSHAVNSVAEFVTTDDPDVVAMGFSSPFLRSIGAGDVVDELRVIIRDRSGPTAYVTFSSQMRPALHAVRVYGPKNGLFVDDDKQLVLKLKGTPYVSYVEKFIPPLELAAQCVGNTAFNIGRFLRRDFHMKSGLKTLIEAFYSSIVQSTPGPVSRRQVLVTSRIVESAIRQVYGDRVFRDAAMAPSPEPVAS
jgi:predicted dehydrogenase